MVKKEEFPQKKWRKWIESEVKGTFPLSFYLYLESKTSLFQIEFSEDFLIILDDMNDPLVIVRKVDSKVIPTLQSARKDPFVLPKIWVDIGAVKFLLNGATLFRPGITKFETFSLGSLVQVVNPQGNVLMIGEALQESASLPSKGPVVQPLTYLNDGFWNSGDLVK